MPTTTQSLSRELSPVIEGRRSRTSRLSVDVHVRPPVGSGVELLTRVAWEALRIVERGELSAASR